MVGVKARSHANCYPSAVNDIGNASKKPASLWSKVVNAVDEVFKFIEENKDWQFTLRELTNVVTSDHVSDGRTIQSKLEEKYKDGIVISNKYGKS